MSRQRIRAAVIGASVGLMGIFGAVGSAQAAVYAGHWDPDFGNAPFANVSWSATAEFSIPDACLGDGTYTSCAGFDVLSGSVTFSEINNPTNVPDETDALPPGFLLTSFTIADGMLTGVNGQFNQVTPGASFAGGGAYSFTLSLFDETDASLSYVTPAHGPAVCGGPDTACGVSANAAALVGGAFVLISPVPEPGTYALMFAGLGVMGFMARRRKS
jgi:hypothetical protein